MIDALRDTEVGAITELAAYTGLCLGEALGLPWRLVDLDKGVIDVEQVVEQCFDKNGTPYPRLRPYPKTASSQREQPLPPQAVAQLRRLKAAYNAKLLAAGMAAAPDHLVFSDPNLNHERRVLPWDPGAPWLPDEFSSWFYLRVGQTGLPRISFKNCCRATFATLLADNGTPTHVVQRLLGHSSHSSVTMRHYVATLDSAKADAAFGASLDRARRRASGEG